MARSGSGTLAAAGAGSPWEVTAPRSRAWRWAGAAGPRPAAGRKARAGRGATATGACLAVLEGHFAAVRGVALSGDGRLLASGGFDGPVRLWDTGSGACLAVLEGHSAAVVSVALGANGRLLASGGADGTVRLWGTANRVAVRTLRPGRPYERMDITGRTGVTGAPRAALLALGGAERTA